MLVSERGPVQVSWCAVSGLLDQLLLPRGAHTPSTREGAGHIRGCEEWAQCDGTHEYTACPHAEVGTVPCTLTAATSLHVVTV